MLFHLMKCVSKSSASNCVILKRQCKLAYIVDRRIYMLYYLCTRYHMQLYKINIHNDTKLTMYMVLDFVYVVQALLLIYKGL